MEMINKGFYNRMVKSTKKLIVPEPQIDPIIAELTFDSETPNPTKKAGKVYKSNAKFSAKYNRRKS
jgi:hypothetical protein